MGDAGLRDNLSHSVFSDLILHARSIRLAKYTLLNECGGLPFSFSKTSLWIASINGAGASIENKMAATAIDVDLRYLNRAAGALRNFGLVTAVVTYSLLCITEIVFFRSSKVRTT